MIVDPDFCDHWKTRMLVNSMDGDEAAPIYVLRLWSHCQNRRQSHFENISEEALKALCRFPGNANKLDASLAASGFIRRDGSTLIVCNWDEYNSGLIANWENGKKGGRPPKNNPTETHGLSTGNPTETHSKPIRVDRKREDKSKNIPPPLLGKLETPGDRATFLTKPNEQFRRWWLMLPEGMRSGEDACWDIWPEIVEKIQIKHSIDEGAAIDRVVHRTQMFANSAKGKTEKFRWSPQTFLTAGHYDDNPASWEIVDKPKTAQQSKPKVKPFDHEES